MGRAVKLAVLVTDGGSGQGRSAVAAVRALALAGYLPVVTTLARHSLAAASRWCAGAMSAPPAESEEYADAVRDAAEKIDALTVLPASDAALLALDVPGGHLVDKVLLAERARAAGLETPPTVEYDTVENLVADGAIGDGRLPVVVKPAISRLPARLVTSIDDLAGLANEDGRLLVQPYLQGTISAIAGVISDGDVTVAVQQRYLRIWPANCGTASAAVTVPVDEHRLLALARVLDGYNGIFQAQFSGATLLDINPRVYGSLSLAVAAGVNLPAIWCARVAGSIGPTRLRGRPGVRYRWLEGDVRHVMSALRQGRVTVTGAVGALAPHLGTAHSIEALSDPGPLVARLRYALGAGRGA